MLRKQEAEEASRGGYAEEATSRKIYDIYSISNHLYCASLIVVWIPLILFLKLST